jgi:hypothetical protein
VSYPYQPYREANPGPGYYSPQSPGDRYYIRLLKHTGALILWHQQSFAVTGTLQECEAAYRSAQTHNLLAGWWSMVSLFLMNWIALFSNMSAIRKVRAMAREGTGTNIQPAVAAPALQSGPPAQTPSGWYPNPSGPGHRYWDGASWTQWTNPPGHG